jgi:hypothetical protein
MEDKLLNVICLIFGVVIPMGFISRWINREFNYIYRLMLSHIKQTHKLIQNITELTMIIKQMRKISAEQENEEN